MHLIRETKKWRGSNEITLNAETPKELMLRMRIKSELSVIPMMFCGEQ